MESKSNEVDWYIVNQLTSNSATIIWSCKYKSKSSIMVSSGSNTYYYNSMSESDKHIFGLSNLESDTQHNILISCSGDVADISKFNFLSFFSTLPEGENLYQLWSRGIWVIGGIDENNRIFKEIDLYDPVNDKWYPSIYSLPTPRAFGGTFFSNNKLVVFGGIVEVSAGLLSATDKVESLELTTGNWKTLNSMPNSLQSFTYGKIGESIYILGGATSIDISNSTLTDTIYKFNPNLGDQGQWHTIISTNTISRRSNFGGCSFNDGTIYFFGGRLYSNGFPQQTSDAYISSTNLSTTSITEPNLSSSRMGLASLCYEPNSTDKYPFDLPAILLVGGSSTIDINTPPFISNASSAFEYYLPNNSKINPNTIQPGVSIPIPSVFGAIAPSYQTREAIYFGGQDELGRALDSVYKINMGNPLISNWSSVSKMPRRRYGFSAQTMRN